MEEDNGRSAQGITTPGEPELKEVVFVQEFVGFRHPSRSQEADLRLLDLEEVDVPVNNFSGEL